MKKQIMKKWLCVCMCMLLLCSLALPVQAAGMRVTFTSDSLPEVGGKLTVDKGALLSNSSITAEEYNALLEGNVIYSWYKNDMLTLEGTAGADAQTYELTLSDQGCTLYVKVSFFEDSSFQESKKCGEALSGKVTITGAAPKITTTSLPNATVGKAYYAKLACTDGDAVFSEIMGSQLSEFGMYLTQHGEIEGTPTKAGNCHVNILAVSEGGGEDSTSYDITVKAAGAATEVEITTKTLPEATVGQQYQVTLGCTDSNATFSVSYNPGKANEFEKTGLTLNKNGNLSGTPTAAGSFTFSVCASGTDGEDYAVYTLTVREAATEPATTPTEEPTQQATEETQKKAEGAKKNRNKDKDEDVDILHWIVPGAVGLVAVGAGVGLAIVLTKKKSEGGK